MDEWRDQICILGFPDYCIENWLEKAINGHWGESSEVKIRKFGVEEKF